MQNNLLKSFLFQERVLHKYKELWKKNFPIMQLQLLLKVEGEWSCTPIHITLMMLNLLLKEMVESLLLFQKMI